MKNIYYWSPCLSRVGTYFAVKNSLLSLSKYSKNLIKINIINACGEWNQEKDFFIKNNINVLDLNFNYFRFLPKDGFLGSRFSYLLIYVFSFIPLLTLLVRNKPKYFIGHLLTSLPLLLFKIFNFKTKFILRISGFPRLNIMRKYFWKFSDSRIHKITCPTKDLKKQILDFNIFKQEKVFFLPDPIIQVSKFNKKLNQRINSVKIQNKNFFLSVGRLTKQKNFKYLISEFNQFLKKNSEYDLLIFGEGELRNDLMMQIKNLKISHKVHLMGYEKDINLYMRTAQAFILSSLWEDPGFVLIEAAFNNLFIVSSNCKNGPKEFLQNGENGIIYQSNSKNKLSESLEKFHEMSSEIKNIKKLNAKKNCRIYSLFNHHNKLINEIINR